jgi:ribonuclease G
MFVSSTPHETKVGLVEDDQLAEVYLERENEYTLAGSIYKGRVTRVLPGMQSAFVDIGLERDAFLYVSDFMELENQEDDLDEIPATPVLVEPRRPERTEVADTAGADSENAETAPSENHAADSTSTTSAPEPKDSRVAWRNRRRRRGGRERGNGAPEARYSRSDSRPANAPATLQREQYGPPPGYQPIILPGESISKYRNVAPAVPAAEPFDSRSQSEGLETPAMVAATFPEDEPVFAQPGHETEEAEGLPFPSEQLDYEENAAAVPSTAAESDEWDRQQKRLHDMNVAAVFGGSDVVEEPVAHDREEADADGRTVIPERSDVRSGLTDHAVETSTTAASAQGTLEEEEIDEEEADLASYVEELEEDAAFEEMEEETRAAGDYVESGTREIAASGENGSGEIPFSAEPVSAEAAELAQAEDEGDEAEEEAEIEEAQAEAEALVDSEGRESGTVDAHAEVRGPTATAAYTQRAPRPAFDRDRGRGGRRFPKGRRFRRQAAQNLPQITDLLKEGQEVLVQIAKEPIGKKGARITSHIALPGRFLVYMPTVNHTGVSRKIASEEERQRLKRIIQSERENGHGGFIVRTAAQGADEQELRADIRFLKGLWTEIRTRAENGKAPALIYHDLNVVERILRDQVTSDFSAIWVDTEQEYERILRFANRFQPALVRRVKLYTKEAPLFEQFGLKEEIDKALKSKVWLKSGGYIVINQTEALVAIDVNTGKYVGKTARLEDTIVKTNVDAIKEIVRQIRLRDLGGIIVIDFIDMDERRNRQKVMQALEEALRADRAPSKVLQFNDFGLVAITRKRVKQSLERTIGSPCPYCEATGFVKNVNTVCNEIYVETRKIAKHLEHADVMLRVNPEVAKALKANNGKWLNELEELTKKTVIVKSDPALHQEQFDLN